MGRMLPAGPRAAARGSMGEMASTASFTSPLAEQLAPDLLERFLRYVRIDTQSRRERERSPSTPGQLDLSRMLVDELRAAGLQDAELDDNGYVMATLPATVDGNPPVIGLIAHVDTSPDEPGAGVEPIVRRSYDGGVGELQDETFTGAAVTLTIHGVDVHPGFATGKLVNAAALAGRILAALPADRLTPATTSGREGFLHVYEVQASAGKAVIRAIARDFDDGKLEQHVALLLRTAEEVVGAEPRARLETDVRAQYPNMRRYLKGFPQVVEAAERAIRAEGIEPVRKPIRGGTDGSRLSAMGLPTPNLFAGGHEFHSVREWVSVQDM